ncbi:hypothetical protein Droror1_Dr00019834 [Drosera rotundifolia]
MYNPNYASTSNGAPPVPPPYTLNTPPYHQNDPPPQQPHPPQLPRLDFPSFDGVEARSWIRKAERYFGITGTEEWRKVEMAAMYLMGKAEVIWDEVGETEPNRDKMLLELEQECLEVYRRKVDHANRNRAQLRQAIADREAELAAICSTMGERPLHIRQIEQMGAILKEELKVILPQLEEMQKRKLERKKQFSDILEQMQKVSSEIHGSLEYLTMEVVDDSDLSIRKLEDL